VVKPTDLRGVYLCLIAQASRRYGLRLTTNVMCNTENSKNQIMRKTLTSALLGTLLTTSGCATAVSPAREAYILAKSHGWVEITISDTSVPARPPREGDEKEYPVSCYLSVNVNHENYMRDELYPIGENSPYSIESGFRIAVSEGVSNIEVTYGGCRVVENEVINHTVETTVSIREGWVTPIVFDGDSLAVGVSELNKAVTLESINDRLKNIESNLGAGE